MTETTALAAGQCAKERGLGVSKHKAILPLAAAALVLLPGAAMGQAWIGQVVGDMMAQQAAAAQELACMKGQAMNDAEIAEARTPAPAVMRGYWEAVQAGRSPAAQFVLNGRTRWTGGGQTLDRTGLARIRDGFAASGNRLAEQPVGFVRAGDGQSALGQWQVSDSAGRPVGLYQILFRRQQGQWLISTMELVDARTWVDPVVQYCHQPGDVLPFRLRNAEQVLAYSERREARARQRLAETVRRAEAAEAAAAANPDSSRRAEAARAARAEVAAREVDLAERVAPLEAARREMELVRADTAAWEAMRAAGMARLAGNR